MSAIQSITPESAADVVRHLEALCKLALVNGAGLSPEQAVARLHQELNYYRELNLEDHTIADVFHRCCMSLANRDRLWRLIYGNRFQELDLTYASILAEYKPVAVLARYEGKVDRLLADLLEARQLSEDKTEHHRSNPRSQFRLYARGILAGAEYFSQFADGAAFKSCIAEWLRSPEVAAERWRTCRCSRFYRSPNQGRRRRSPGRTEQQDRRTASRNRSADSHG